MSAACVRFDLEKIVSRVPPISFGALPQEAFATRLSSNLAHVVLRLRKEIDAQLTPLLHARSAEEFEALRSETFGHYANLMNAAASIVMGTTERHVHQDLARQSFEGMQRTFGTASDQFGTEAAAVIHFTIATLERTYLLVRRMNANAQPLTDATRELRRRGVLCFACALFHLDCLRLALEQGTKLHPAVSAKILYDLRELSLEAYASARQRHESPEPTLGFADASWDEEDEVLAVASTREIDCLPDEL
ncbi:MAG TPA: hypothetical protein VNK82_10045 [Terriglobales bacterium]|nr:hypothetical protein [Terriglobales bacterium]